MGNKTDIYTSTSSVPHQNWLRRHMPLSQKIKTLHLSPIPAVLGCKETNSVSPLDGKSCSCWHSKDKDKSSIITRRYQALDSHQLSLPLHIVHFFQLNFKKETGCTKPQTPSSPSPSPFLLYNLLKVLDMSFHCHCFLLFSAFLTPPLLSFCRRIWSVWARGHVSFKAQLWLHSQRRRKQPLLPN